MGGLLEVFAYAAGSIAFTLLTLGSIGIWSYAFVDIALATVGTRRRVFLLILMIAAAPIGLGAWALLIVSRVRHALVIKVLAGIAAVYIVLVLVVPFLFPGLALQYSTLIALAYYVVGLIPALGIAGTRIIVERRSASRTAATAVRPPGIWFWVQAFCVLVALVSLVGTLLLVVGVAGVFGTAFSIGHDAGSLTTVGTFMVFTLGGAILYGVVPVVGARTWMWTYVTVLLGISALTCMLPLAVAIFIFWLRDDCRMWFAAQRS